MTEMSAVTPSAMIVQMKQKAPVDFAISPPTPFPVMWRTGTILTGLTVIPDDALLLGQSLE
jgi:hypothetical protein